MRNLIAVGVVGIMVGAWTGCGGTGSIPDAGIAASPSTSGGGTTSSGTSSGTTGAGSSTGTTGLALGQATVEGALAMPVASAFEETCCGDGGLSSVGFNIKDYSTDVCGTTQAYDGGHWGTPAIVNGQVMAGATNVVTPGTFAINENAFGPVFLPDGGAPPDGGIHNANGERVYFFVTGDPRGGFLTSHYGMFGTITYASVSTTSLAGTYDATAAYPDGGDATRVTGQFNVPNCPGQ